MIARVVAVLAKAPLATVPLAALLAVAPLAAGGCKKDGDKQAVAAKPPPKAPAPPAAPQPAAPPPGSDADLKRQSALALAKGVDDALATFTRVEKDLPAGPDGKPRAAEAWHVGKLPKKLVIKTKDATGVVSDTTDVYYDEQGRIGFARAPDGLFVFNMESLALWLDAEQRVKRGVSPNEARTRVDALKLEAAKALSVLGVR